MKRFATSLLFLCALVAAPLALTGCTADTLTGPDAGTFDAGGNQNGSSNTNPDRDILD